MSSSIGLRGKSFNGFGSLNLGGVALVRITPAAEEPNKLNCKPTVDFTNSVLFLKSSSVAVPIKTE